MKILKEFLVCVILVCPCLMANEFEPKLNLTSLYDYDYSQEYYEDLDKKSQTELPEVLNIFPEKKRNLSKCFDKIFLALFLDVNNKIC